MNNETVLFYFQRDVNHLSINKIILEVSALHSLSQKTKSYVIACLIGSFVIGSYFKSALYSYMYKKGKDIFSQAINLLVLIKALIVHLACILMVTFYTIGLILDVSLAEIFGEIWCNVPWYIASFTAAYRTFGDLGIAVLRLFYIKCPQHIGDNESRKKIVYAVLAISIILSTASSIGFKMGNGDFSRKQLNWNFCTGRSEEFGEIVHNYSLITGERQIQSDNIAKSVVLIGMFGILAEFVCYVVFFKHLYTHDEKMLKSKLLPANVIKQRHRTNAITFLGQFYEFMVKCARITLLTYSMWKDSDMNYRMIMVISFWIEFGIVSIVEVMSSRNLKENLPFKLA